jgi:Glycosyltransferase family 87
VPTRSRFSLAVWWLLPACLIACFGVWYWAVEIFAPANTAAAYSKHRPIGNNSDLYARWYGTRELLVHHRDPYSREITREIQIGFYGRPLNPGSLSDPTAQEAFNYPLYAAFLVAPFAALPFPVAQQVFRWMALFLIAGSVPLWMRALGFRAGRVLVASAMVLAAGSYPAVMEFYQQNLAALVIFLIAAAAAGAARGWLGLSGLLMALATVKPEITGLVLVWFLLWGTAEWAERRRFVLSFTVSFACLVLAAEFFSPHWSRRFISAVWKYQSSEADPSLLRVLLPSFVAKLVMASLVCALPFALWRWRKSAAGSAKFGWALAWTSASTLMLLPKLAAYNQLLLLPAILVLLFQEEMIRTPALLTRSFGKGAFACQIWQWGAASSLVLCSLILPAEKVRKFAEIPLYTLLALPPLTLLAVLMGTLERASNTPSTT